MLETLWYEISPYVYTVAAGLTLLQGHSALAWFSAALLLITAVMIVRMRWTHRRNTKANPTTMMKKAAPKARMSQRQAA